MIQNPLGICALAKREWHVQYRKYKRKINKLNIKKKKFEKNKKMRKNVDSHNKK